MFARPPSDNISSAVVSVNNNPIAYSSQSLPERHVLILTPVLRPVVGEIVMSVKLALALQALSSAKSPREATIKIGIVLLLTNEDVLQENETLKLHGSSLGKVYLNDRFPVLKEILKPLQGTDIPVYVSSRDGKMFVFDLPNSSLALSEDGERSLSGVNIKTT